MKSFLKFIREERKYIILFIITCVFYLLFYSGRGREQADESPDSPDAVKKLEQLFEEHVQDEEYWKMLQQEKPWLLPLALTGTGLLVLTLGYGLILNLAWIINRRRGKNLVSRVADHPEQKWSLRDLFRVPILFMSASLVLATFVHLLRLLFAWQENTNFLILLQTLMTDMAVMFSILYFIRFSYGQNFRSLGLDFSHGLRDLWIGLSAYCAILPILLLLLIALISGAAWLGYHPPPHPLVEVLVEEDKRNPSIIFFSIVLACVVGPVVEEIFFRGFCYPILKKRWGVKIALVVSAAFFSAIHQSGFAFVPVFVLGMMLAYLYEIRGTLVPSIVLHVAHNSLFLGYFFFLKSLFVDV